MGDLDSRFEKFFDSSFQGDLRCPKGLENVFQGGRLLDEMTDLFREVTNIHEERISHGQNELYDSMKKLSDTELDRVFASVICLYFFFFIPIPNLYTLVYISPYSTTARKRFDVVHYP
jgi:hypothetical protein